MKANIQHKINRFFIESNDFNGIPLRQISIEMKIGYEESIDYLKELVKDQTISIQSSLNPHIIRFQHLSIDIQKRILEEAKNIKSSTHKFGNITMTSENSAHSICIYPSPNILRSERDLTIFTNSHYTKKLALAEPQLKPIFFDIEVLERYSNDPRLEFRFEDYSGSIYSKLDDNDNSIVRKEDEIFLKTFGLGFDENGNRLAVVYLRYLKNLTNEHQIYWHSKEAKGICKILKEYHENTVIGSWTFSYSIFSAFIGELNCLNEITRVSFDKNLFRKSFEEGKRPKEFTFFFTPTLKNYNEFVLLLDKMISENINKYFFEGKVELYDTKEIEEGLIERNQKGTLRLLEEWLCSMYSTENQNAIKEIFTPFKKVRNERQKPAHRINENEYNKKFIEKQNELINKSYSSMRALRQIFQQHPKARLVEIPTWLDKGKIKIF